MVSINPESKSRAVNREVLSELIKLHGKTSLGGKLPAYDGRKSLYTAGSLPFESEEFSVTLVDPEKKDKEKAEREYKITIWIAGRTDLYHLQQFLKGRQRDMPQETIQVLDVVLRESPSWNYVTVSRSFFSTTFGHRGDIGEGLECWRGYYQSLRPTQMGLSLNIDISATSFFKPVTVVQFVLEFLNLRDASRPLTDRDCVKIKKALRGVRVETNHQEDQIRRYKITGITPVPMSQLIFPVDERGTRMSVVQYFMQRYKYNLQYTSWPCLQSGSDARPVYLPMEACKIVEGQRYSKKLNDKQVTCQRPQQREPSIREMVLHNKYAEDKFAQEFGINVCSDLVSVPARMLPPHVLRYHDSGKEKTCAPSVGQWNMINKKMINGGIIDNWACVSFSRMHPEEVHRFCCDLIQMCNMTGMSVNPRPLVDNRSASPNHIENALRDVHRRTTEMLGKQGHEKQLQLLIVILPEVSGSYGKIKKVCETDLGIVSQCCLPRHAARPNKQYLENVALKINVKVGGRNTVLERAFVRNGIPFVSEVPTIIFGADVTHPPPGEDSASSIAAVVASMDWPEITKYRGLVSAEPHRQEIIEDLFSVTKDPQRGNGNGGMIRELLIAFRRKTGRRPERILFYRDGVSEGQFSHVLLHEMDAIRKACASLEEGYMPPVTFVVVQKRHHTRLFPEVHGRRDMTDKSGNILPGTVVDLMICHPTEFDFYLCSHAGIQGTRRPTHCRVLYDENHFTANALQSLTNNLFCTHYMKIMKALHCACVETNQQQDQIRRYKITGITPIPMSQLKFPVDERGTRMSVVQYFMQRYKYNLQYTSWPCLQSGSDVRPVYLPMEACKIVEGQRYSKKLNDKQVTNILRGTCQHPQQREQSIRENLLQLLVESPVRGSFAVQIDCNLKCSMLRKKIEDILGRSINLFTLRARGKYLEDNVALKEYKLPYNATVQLILRLFGGADSPPSRKRTRRDSSPSRSDEPPALSKQIYDVCLSGMIPLGIYVKNRERFFKKVIIPDIAAEGHMQYVDDFSDDGISLGDSFLEKFINAEKNNLTWGGQLKTSDFAVFSGRLVPLKPLKANASAEELQLDKVVLVKMLRSIFCRSHRSLPYIVGFLEFLQNGKNRNCPELLPYKRRPLVFMTPLQRASLTNSAVMVYLRFGSGSPGQILYKKVVNEIEVEFWPGAKGRRIFKPLVAYQIRKHLKDTYEPEPFGCLMILRNHNEHGEILPWDLLDHGSHLTFGDFLQDVMIALLENKFEVNKALE
ncbi:hypothetical protein ACQJBY_052095 [Aegilops geniculata]